MVVGAGEADKWLESVLEQRFELVDDMVVCGNNVDEKTHQLIKKFGCWFYRDDREWGMFQPQIKQDLLEKVGGLNPDWIIATDADEIFDKQFTRGVMDKMMGLEVFGYYFAIMNLWDDEHHYRHDLSFWNIRFWNYNMTKKVSLDFERKRLHCGLAPPIVYKEGVHAPFLIKHYGLMLPEDRKKKVERYKKYDPDAKFKGRMYYDSLENNESIFPFNEDEMHERVVRDVEKYGYREGDSR